jgi:hypothetical protein
VAVQNLLQLIARSSIISRYEKPRFRDFVLTLSSREQQRLAAGLEELLHGDGQTGFNLVLEMLKRVSLAKWPIITAARGYFRPSCDVLVKPTTVKIIIEYFELTPLQYRATPTWAFYEEYRAALNEMKSKVDPALSPSNIGFSWFLLVSSHRHFV